jgi:hypothetical protein
MKTTPKYNSPCKTIILLFHSLLGELVMSVIKPPHGFLTCFARIRMDQVSYWRFQLHFNQGMAIFCANQAFIGQLNCDISEPGVVVVN